MFSAYILQSDKNGKYYKRKLLEHDRGYSRYTKNKGPFKLVYKEDFETRSEASKKEYYWKSLKSRKAIEKIVSNI